MFPKPLREYEAVSHAEDVASSSGIDLRRLGWVRPLAGDVRARLRECRQPVRRQPGGPRRLERGDHPRPAAVRGTGTASRPCSRPSRSAAARRPRRGPRPPSSHDPRTVAVVTGQQAGVFGGPLYTLLKAITALQLARRTAAEHGVPTVAIFWVDAEDHDWEEVRSNTVLDAALQPRTVSLARDRWRGTAAHRRAPRSTTAWRPRSRTCVRRSRRATSPTGSSAEAARAWRPGAGMADAFARWLDALLGPHGLIVFESADPAAKPFVADLFARELQFPGRTSALAASAGDDLAGTRSPAAGRAAARQRRPVPARRHARADPPPGRSPGRRRRDVRDVGAGRAGSGPARALQPERAAPARRAGRALPDHLLRRRPERAGVPRSARGVYEHFGVPMPLVYPRATAPRSSTPPRAASSARYDVPIDDLQPQDESALNRLLQSQLPPDGRAGAHRRGRRPAPRARTHHRRDSGGGPDADGRGENDARARSSTICGRCTAR